MSIRLDITGLGHEGEGVGRHEGIATFVPGALPGETVLVEVTEKKKNFQRGVLQEIIVRSSERRDAPCAVYEDCGGCQLQHLGYAETLAWKRIRVGDALQRIGRIEAEVKPVIGMRDPWRYRNKVQLHSGPGYKLGYFSTKTNRLVPFTDCLLIPTEFNHLKDYLEGFLKNKGVSPVRVEHVIIRNSPASGEIMLGLVGELPKGLPWDKIIARFPQVKSIMTMGGKSTELLAGKPFINDVVMGNDFQLSLQSFVQVNPTQTEVLYKQVLDYAQLSGKETVMDVYCGIGTITMALARRASSAIGIEIVEQAVRDAEENARVNKMGNTRFYAGPAERILPDLAAKGVQADVIVVDPPRKGCEKPVLDAIVQMAPARVVYVSCDAATLARDLGYMMDRGYETVEVQPVDMFPWTAHVESIILMMNSGLKGK